MRKLGTDNNIESGTRVRVEILKNGYWTGRVFGTFVRRTSEFRATVNVEGVNKSFSTYNISY